MKCLAGESAGSFVIEGIAEQRMADVGHVDADLVGAAGFEVEFEVGENGAVREGAVMGYGALAGYVRWISRERMAWERTAALKACLASTIRPVVSRSRRLMQR